MPPFNAKMDGNSRPTLTALSSANDGSIVQLWADPTTHALLVDATGGTGTVTSVSVVSANGFAGSVANSTTTPAITISTTVTGLLKGNGTAISAAVANTDYQSPITLTTTGTSGAATFNGTTLNIPVYSSGGGSGDVTGPASSTDNAVARFDGTTGKIIQNSAVTISDTLGDITAGKYNTVAITGTSTPVISVTGTANISGTNTGDQTITLTGDVTGSGTGSFAATLATVNSNVGSFGSSTQASTFTVNGKGLITAAGQTTVTPAVGSITGFGTGVGTALAVNVGSAGAFVTFNGALGTPSSGVATNLTGTASGLTAGTVTTNANLTGDVTSTGNATTLATVNSNVGSFTSANITVNAKGLITAASNGTAPTPTVITVANEATDTTCFPAFFTAATGDLGPKTNAGWTYNSNTNLLTSTGQFTMNALGLTGTVSGTATLQATTAATITVPPSTSTLATLALSETFTNKTLTSAKITTGLEPTTDDGAALGTTTKQFSDLFLATGGVVNWNNGNTTLTQSSNALTVSGSANVTVSVGTGSIAGTLQLRNGDGAYETIAYAGGTASTYTLPGGTTTIVGTTTAQTITNKRNQPRVISASSYTTDTGTSLSVATTDLFVITAQAGALKFNNPGGTPVQGEKLMIRIKDNGTARALTYDTQFRASSDLALPTTTIISKTLYMGFVYNSTDTKWDLLAVLNNF